MGMWIITMNRLHNVVGFLVLVILVVTTIKESSCTLENNLYANVGSAIILNCSLESNNSIQWVHVDKQIIYSEGIVVNSQIDKFQNSSRIEIVGNHELGEYNLKIKEVQENDSGMYRCDANIDGKAASELFNLHVREDGETSEKTITRTIPPAGFLLFEAVVVYSVTIVGICALPLLTVFIVKKIREHSKRKQKGTSSLGDEDDNSTNEHSYEDVSHPMPDIQNIVQHEINAIGVAASGHSYEPLQDNWNTTSRLYDSCTVTGQLS